MSGALPCNPSSLRAVPAAKRVEVEIEARRLSLSNLEKPMYPAAGFTKGHVIDYYTRVAPALLPHLRGRPITLKRYPDGVDGPHFYEKQCPSHRPDWVRTARVESSRARDGRIEGTLPPGRHYLWRPWDRVEFVVDTATEIPYLAPVAVCPTLVWLANLADLELHTSLALAEAYTSPTVIAFDLDPGPPANVVQCAEVALELRTIFDHLGMQAFAKTSGSKGMQVYVPLNTPTGYEETSRFAHALAQVLERRRPELVLSEMTRAKRAGKVFVDWSQNSRHKTTVSVYSLRALPEPTVSTPLSWDEVEAASEPADLVFRAPDVLERVAEHGDLFAGVLELEQRLPEAL